MHFLKAYLVKKTVQGMLFMRRYVKLRAIEIVENIVEMKATVRQAAKKFWYRNLRYI